MKRLKVELKEKSYDICISPGLLANSAALLGQTMKGASKAAIISDSNVWPLYGGKLQKALSACGIENEAIIIKAGEESKNIESLKMIFERCAAMRLSRKSFIIALGGGVVGDIAGLAASLWMRGIPYIQIPTTLLAQVDSSVGGKTAVDLDAGKNLVGTFWQPSLVLIDTDTLTTLTEREFQAGMGEVCKYGAACSSRLFRVLEKSSRKDASFASKQTRRDWIGHLIYACCQIKAGIVANDEKDENGVRAILNFGHTFGHAIEKKYNFSAFKHGEAVAAG
ncbi:MAG: 3-dehydroquinate synthase, partial [Spirochaetaceae bacterium]|nr:3-dehydroquinate synthase [Spirochaetaceae bacterium]